MLNSQGKVAGGNLYLLFSLELMTSLEGKVGIERWAALNHRRISLTVDQCSLIRQPLWGLTHCAVASRSGRGQIDPHKGAGRVGPRSPAGSHGLPELEGSPSAARGAGTGRGVSTDKATVCISTASR